MPRPPRRRDRTHCAETCPRCRACTSWARKGGSFLGSLGGLLCGLLRGAPFDKLRERPKSAGLQIGSEAVTAALAAVARLLVATEGARRVEPVEGVRPDHAGTKLVCDREDLAPLVAPDAGRQSVRGVVGLGNRLGRGTECQHGEHWPEHLFAGDAMAGRHIGEDGRCEPEALIGNGAVRRPALGSFFFTDIRQLADAVELLL